MTAPFLRGRFSLCPQSSSSRPARSPRLSVRESTRLGGIPAFRSTSVISRTTNQSIDPSLELFQEASELIGVLELILNDSRNSILINDDVVLVEDAGPIDPTVRQCELFTEAR